MKCAPMACFERSKAFSDWEYSVFFLFLFFFSSYTTSGGWMEDNLMMPLVWDGDAIVLFLMNALQT